MTYPTTQELEASALKKVEERARCKRDKLFLSQAMGWDFVPDVHQELFDQFIPYDPKKPWQHQVEIKNRITLWPRGHYKSTAIQVEIVQAILNFPDITILIMRGGLGVTRTLLKEIKAYFTGANPKSRLRELFPEFCGQKNKDGVFEFLDKLGNVDEFTVPCRVNKGIPQATVTVASPGAITTSQHYDIMFFDDLIHAKNYRSKTQLAKVEDDFSGFFPLLNPGGYRFVTGTRYAHGELYEKIIVRNTNKEWKVSVKTCWGDDGLSVRFPRQSSPLDPNKLIGFTREELESFMREDPAKFCSQYLNQPAMTGTQRFTTDLLDMTLVDDGKAPPLSMPVIIVDLASSESEDADDSVAMVGRTDGQNIYLADFVGGQWGPEILANAVIGMANKHRPQRILLENTASCKYFVEYLRLMCRQRGIVLPIELIKVDTQKDAKNIRIDLLAGHMKGRRFKILRSCAANPRWSKLVDQCIKWQPSKERHSRHDDYPDTMALMVRELAVGVMMTALAPARLDPILEMVRATERQEAYDRAMTEPDAVETGGAGDYIAW